MLVQPTGEGHDEKGKWIQSSAHGAGNYRPERRPHTPIISIRLSSCSVRDDKSPLRTPVADCLSGATTSQYPDQNTLEIAFRSPLNSKCNRLSISCYDTTKYSRHVYTVRTTSPIHRFLHCYSRVRRYRMRSLDVCDTPACNSHDLCHFICACSPRERLVRRGQMGFAGDGLLFRVLALFCP